MPPKSSHQYNVHRLTVLALFTTLALALYLAESLIPAFLPIPGIKLGLSNIVTLILLLYFSPADAFLVLISRILLSAVFSGQVVSLFYSLCGGIFCFLIMTVLNRLLSGHFIFITSIFGALFHNLGQLCAACLILQSAGVFLYLPFLIISGSLTGLFTGLCAFFLKRFLLPHIPLRDLQSPQSGREK